MCFSSSPYQSQLKSLPSLNFNKRIKEMEPVISKPMSLINCKKKNCIISFLWYEVFTWKQKIVFPTNIICIIRCKKLQYFKSYIIQNNGWFPHPDYSPEIGYYQSQTRNWHDHEARQDISGEQEVILQLEDGSINFLVLELLSRHKKKPICTNHQ